VGTVRGALLRRTTGINCFGEKAAMCACMRYTNRGESQLKSPPIRPSRALAVFLKGREKKK
jgi:hypothetical protein